VRKEEAVAALNPAAAFPLILSGMPPLDLPRLTTCLLGRVIRQGPEQPHPGRWPEVGF
jgi:hypothetical protein